MKGKLERRVVVLGCGNPFAGDDGVGLEVLQALRETGELPDRVELVEAGAPGFGLLELMYGYDTAIIVDAVMDPKGEPGRVLQWEEGDLPAKKTAALSVHDIGIRDTLAFGRRTLPEQMPSRVAVVGITVAGTERWHMGLTPAVAGAVPAAAVAVKKLIEGQTAK
ncbi:MAG: hydrogenase maturation protease [Bacillota bacterium]|nr:hydrogenase maturation protease [Bacillota bacterium]